MLASPQHITLFSLIGLLSFFAISVPGTSANNLSPGGHFLRMRKGVNRLAARLNTASAIPRADSSPTDSLSSVNTQTQNPTTSETSGGSSSILPTSLPAVNPSTTKQPQGSPTSHAQTPSSPSSKPGSSSQPPVQQAPSSSNIELLASSSTNVFSTTTGVATPIYIPNSLVTDSGTTLPLDISSYLAATPSDGFTDTSNVPSDTATEANSPNDSVTTSGFLANKGAVAAVASISGVAGLTLVIFFAAVILRRRARKRRQDRWERKSHVWVDGADQDDGMAGFEKVEPGSVVQMSAIPNTASRRTPPAEDYHYSYNSERDYFASSTGLVLMPQSEDAHRESGKHKQNNSVGSVYPPTLLDAYGVRQSYATTHDHAPVPAIDYPPGMAYSPESHDQYDAQQQRKLQDLHKYTLESVPQQISYGYAASPRLPTINRETF